MMQANAHQSSQRAAVRISGQHNKGRERGRNGCAMSLRPVVLLPNARLFAVDRAPWIEGVEYVQKQDC